MASPDVFQSSPMRPPRRASLLADSSSPLPTVQDLVSQVPRRPPIRSGSRANPIPDGATSTFTSAREHWKSAQAAAANEDTSVSVIEIAPEPVPKPRKPRTRKPAPGKKTKKGVEDGETAELSATDQPWKKYVPSPKAKTGRAKAAQNNAPDKPPEKKDAFQTRKVEKTGTVSEHFPTRNERPVREKSTRPVEDESLYLEPAMSRRVDWTPPPENPKTAVDIGSHGPTQNDINSSATDGDKSGLFKSLLENYGCSEQPSKEAVVISDEDLSFLKKRKRIELLNTNEGSRSVSPALDKSPTKKKAPKKKPRTITELATAAYRPATKISPVPAAEPAVGRLSNGDGGPRSAGSSAKGNVKGPGRKKPVKKTKKKPPPPEPVLLSPGTALKEVSKQDFVFGTSSQLVREQSPSLLREIQSAIGNLTEMDFGNGVTPLNSDMLEPSEQRQKLWDAAARDTDGQLFDAEIIDLVDGSPQCLPADDTDDPFGYFKAEEENVPVVGCPTSPRRDSLEILSDALPPPTKRPESNDRDHSGPRGTYKGPGQCVEGGDGDTFDILPDILPRAVKQPQEIADDDSPFSSSQISVSTDIEKPKATSDLPTQKASAQIPAAVDTQQCRPEEDRTLGKPKRPTFELYTDAQLTKEISSYGFKPVKRRAAMISLLDQCWQSKNSTVAAGTRTITTSAGPSEQPPAIAQVAASPKRKRGRPRKNSIGIEPQDPPPSAQPMESPMRPRGRPRKDSTSSKGVSSRRTEPPPSGQALEFPKRPRGRPRKDSTSPSRLSPVMAATMKHGKASTAEAPPRPSTPTRKPAVPRTIVEIPDSASEAESDMSPSSPFSSPGQTFSPPPAVDLSLSMEEDNELSLTMAPDAKQEALFERITEAVTSAPRSTDPANPSWYEKMLLYDPIVLEGLTAWLNSGQLTRVGYDGEVNPGEVKKWCESKSVCCLWRVNLRGKERKRF
ncbi:Structure-specific endonuclease subunit-like protein [Hapsidospora chrysogenum ATCC 11550]|uniref:Structure-specific endonuclease subunit SLX4 n=1 Tax=Hapsidospora chrysogenum (strain ATCC 11550 / CBS 779.69 / DSM 880 / IAM 14645 / JCM 23072 / IMI 49137) TaxID=857340 RepID=A0A086TCR8_HAPC1|nr:Structure-specific endonuclease subunit-like protein [Hapsidospora chrysogenum ATCC 11550]